MSRCPRANVRAVFALIPVLLGPLAGVRGQGKNHDGDWARADSIAVVGSTRIGLRIAAWRDFMPHVGGAGGGSDLMVNVQVGTRDAAPLPKGLAVDSAWLRSPDGVWATAPSQESRPDLANGLDLMLRGGPTWDRPVDVLVRLRFPAGTIYLRALNQSIGRTM